MDENEAFKVLCKKNGWKCTPQRLAVYSFMKHNLLHPSVDDVWNHTKKIIPTITRESVYRILNEFDHAGLVFRMDKIESAHYDSRTQPHGHLVCDICGKITDFQLEHVPDLPAAIPENTVHHIEVRISWTCPDCEASKKTP